MSGKRRLCDMKPGETGRVAEVSDKSGIYRRLQDLGLVCGTPVECLMKSPLGDPTAYLIRGAVIALREDDAKFVIIRGDLNGAYEKLRRQGRGGRRT